MSFLSDTLQTTDNDQHKSEKFFPDKTASIRMPLLKTVSGYG